jgi:DNA-binding transcriptional LysR family regulator
MLNLRRLDLNLLTVFEAIFAENSLTRAADRIGMSQPAVSNALTRLRAVMQDELFVREGNTMQPTPRARQLARPVQEALNLIREGLTQTEQFDPAKARKFIIAGNEHVDFEILPRLVHSLAERMGNIYFETIAGNAIDLRDKLKSGLIDVLVDIQPLQDEEFEVRQITEGVLVSLVRKGHPLAGKQLSLQEVFDLRHVILRAQDEYGFYVERFLREHGQQDSIAVRVAHVSSLPIVVAQTDMMCTVPEHLARPMMEYFDLEVLDTPIPRHAFSIVMMWHRSLNHDSGNRWLRAQILKSCRNM